MSSANLLQNVVSRFRETSFNLLQNAEANRDKGFFNIVTLHVDNSSIAANRMILACNLLFLKVHVQN